MKATDFKLYQSNGLPNSRRVRTFLAEKGIIMPMVPVDLGAKEQFSDAYAKINPRPSRPHVGSRRWHRAGEVPAILRYLEDVYPDPPLYGTSPSERAVATMWEREMELEGFDTVMETVRTAPPAFTGGRLPDRMRTNSCRAWSSARGCGSVIPTSTSTPIWRRAGSSPGTDFRSPISLQLSPSTSPTRHLACQSRLTRRQLLTAISVGRSGPAWRLEDKSRGKTGTATSSATVPHAI